jgi:hypothetical protein
MARLYHTFGDIEGKLDVGEAQTNQTLSENNG